LDHQYINEQEIKVANITATQKQALSGMNLSDHERRMKELEAELEAVKARIAETKANIANLKADQKLIESAQPQDTYGIEIDGKEYEVGFDSPPTEEALQKWREKEGIVADRGLTGERGEDGTLLSEEESKKRGSFAGSSADLATGEVSGEKGDAMALARAAGNIPTEEMIEEGIPVHPATVQQVEEDDMITDKQIADPEDDIEADRRTDAYSEKQKFMGIDREQGRAMAMQDDLPDRSMGFKDKDGYMSVDEKDDFWKTQEGYDKAIEMYGSKPAWVKEPTLIWNPSEQKYEEIEEEEFEDLSRPAVSADIKKLFG